MPILLLVLCYAIRWLLFRRTPRPVRIASRLQAGGQHTQDDISTTSPHETDIVPTPLR